MRGLLSCLIIVCSGTVCLAENPASETLSRIDQRFTADQAETPDFQRHVVPMLSKIGCNGRACHGSFQGRGGFMLSLFGYDFEMDHKGLSERVDTDAPEESYALLKAQNLDEHEGGQKIQPGSWEHQVFLNWIRGGATGVATESKLKALEVTPSEIQFARTDQSVQLQVVAVWEDGSREDVTPLCRFQSNDTSIAEVSDSGHISAGATGDTHVVVFYDNGTQPIPVIRPVSDLVGDNYPLVATPTRVDELVVEKLKKLGIVPAETCEETEFLRRVMLDLTGTLPTPSQVKAFLADDAADKRTRKIDELLETPAYSAWWATRFSDYTGNTPNQLNNVSFNNTQASQDWHEWLRARIAANVPYDQIVRGIVLASSLQPGETYEQYSERMTGYFQDKTGQKFAEQDSLPYYWARRNFQTAEDRAVGFAYTFLGVRIQCAQCHKHPFDQWTQDDFKEFQPLFTKARYAPTGPNPRDYQAMVDKLEIDPALRGGQLRTALARLASKGEVVPFPALVQQAGRGNPRRNNNNNSGREVQARMLGGEPFDMNQYADPREPLMEWMTGEARFLFAKAIVNRIWGNYFHRGIVEPTDDLSLANPPSNAALLDYLTQGFLDHGYDLKWLHREICNSRTYQLSWRPNATNELDERNFSRAIPRRLQAEVAYDAIQVATTSHSRADQALADLNGRAIAIPGTGQGRGGNNYILTTFGKSARENNCDCERSTDATLLQTLFTFNDNEFLSVIDSRNGWLNELAREWNQPLNGNANQADNNNRRQPNFDDNVRRMRAQLERIDREAQPERYRMLRLRLREYMQQKQNADQVPEQAPAPEQAENSTARRLPAVTAQNAAITEAYLRTLSRYPNEAELAIGRQAISAAETPVDGMRDVLWALINSKAFIVNH